MKPDPLNLIHVKPLAVDNEAAIVVKYINPCDDMLYALSSSLKVSLSILASRRI
jgi:hypothetical protein